MPFPNTPILDNFNRANEGPPASASWTDLLNGSLVVSNELAGNTNAADIVSFWNPATPGPDCEAFIDIGSVKGTDDVDYLGVLGRLQDTGAFGTLDGYGVFFLPAVGTDLWAAYRIDNSVFTQLGATLTEETGINQQLGMRVVGTTILGFEDGVEIISRTDATYTTAGSIGVHVFSDVFRMDDFGGGDYSQIIAIGLVTETDIAFPITPEKRVTIGLASEADSALALQALKTAQIGLVTEIDLAQAITAVRRYTLGLASESDAALALQIVEAVEIGLVTETDLALALIAGAPSLPGLEYTALINRLHYLSPEERMHYAANIDRLHYVAPDED